jgi:hypothetical protein
VSAGDLGSLGIPAHEWRTVDVAKFKCPTTADRIFDARLGLSVLAVALACIYLVSAATTITRSAAVSAALSGIAILQVGWLFAARKRRISALMAGIGLNALLGAVWVLSRTSGLPVGPAGPQPVGVLDVLCAVDSATAVMLAWTLTRPVHRLPRITPAISQCAIVLAVASLASFASGHTHLSRASPDLSGRLTTAAYYCHLL